MNAQHTDSWEFARKLAPHFGGQLIEDDSHFPTIALHAERVRLFIRDAWNKRGMITIHAWPDNSQRCHRLPSANVSATRPIESIVADIRRRVIEPAKPILREHYQSEARAANQAAFVRQRCRELGEALRQEPSKHWSCHFHTDSMDIEHSYYLSGEYTYRAEIRVHSWEALLQIARILAEDHTYHKAKNQQAA